ncbi:MAG: FxsA family protein [Oligoflexales bacterium]|nr:FxsA family protein [Oligoflexales bacterium]
MPFFTILLFFIIFLEVSVFSLVHTTLSVYFNSENASLTLILETILTGFLAYRMLKQQGLKSFVDLQKASQVGTSPESILISQLTNLISAILLFIPGIVSDLLALLLLYSPLKKALFARLIPTTNHTIFSNIFNNQRRWHESEPQYEPNEPKEKKVNEDIIDVEAEDLSRGR